MQNSSGLVVEGLKKNFGKKTAVRDVSFSMKDGGNCRLIGTKRCRQDNRFLYDCRVYQGYCRQNIS